ncbi:carbohydrate ABC transporter permease [Aciditerrimonas ferrireducens]|jgi:sn-glycerol 3-phosphate transport system permease protein|uniref:sn-glycerol-3-phosphate transport system permease protein UgpA n=1 Tax=Aciditerrimonas ferrireducens TaxID=667306 RepID=A0ABV6C476_9ACTN|nr:ABC transporter permease subunit [Aciditerrimonas ferrireducens]MCK4176015.1 ABC transporter permease subunit [Aciditerrimonas ferrireducens]
MAARRRAATRGTFPGWLLPLALILPELVVVGLFFLYPAARVVEDSVTASNAFGLSSRFVGLANFRALFSGGDELHSLEVTALFVGVTTLVAMALGLFLAVQVEQLGRSRVLFRTLFVWPYAVPAAIGGTLWLFLFEPGIGPGARLLADLGVRWNFALHGPQAMVLVMAIFVWQQVGYNLLFYLAALQGVPSEFQEAAQVDGAGKLRTFWRVVFPLLGPTTFFLLVMDLLAGLFGSFAVVDLVTQGGPAGATSFLVYQLYRDGFVNSNANLAAAETIVLLVIAGVLTVFQFRFLNRRVHYR